MSSVLKGNFETKNKVETENEKEDDLDSKFERAAMKRLGGSISFVRKKQIDWGDDDNGAS